MRASLSRDFIYRTYVGASGTHSKIAVPQDLLEGTAECHEVYDMLVGFKMEVLNDEEHPTTLKINTDGLETCRHLDCLSATIVDTSRPG